MCDEPYPGIAARGALEGALTRGNAIAFKGIYNESAPVRAVRWCPPHLPAAWQRVGPV